MVRKVIIIHQNSDRILIKSIIYAYIIFKIIHLTLALYYNYAYLINLVTCRVRTRRF